MNKDLGGHEGVVTSTGNGVVKIATRKGMKTLPQGFSTYKEGEKVTFDDTLGVVGKKRSASSSTLFRV